MDQVKDAFQKVKGDISFLKQDLNSLKNDLEETKETIKEVCKVLEKINIKFKNSLQTSQKSTPTDNQKKETLTSDVSTQNIHFKPLNDQNMPISIGNEGVPTDKQTNKQTNKQTEISGFSEQNTSIDDAVEILNSLDNVTKEIRLKFKRLTDQELLVFSTIYQLDEEKKDTDYKTLAKKLNLTESSIRDYVGRLVKKGIPVGKKKINNKKIYLSIPPNFKKIASLPTIFKLRDI